MNSHSVILKAKDILAAIEQLPLDETPVHTHAEYEKAMESSSKGAFVIGMLLGAVAGFIICCCLVVEGIVHA